VSFFRKDGSCYPGTSAPRLENQKSNVIAFEDRQGCRSQGSSGGVGAIFEIVAAGKVGMATEKRDPFALLRFPG
jgi:hypothetical protein